MQSQSPAAIQFHGSSPRNISFYDHIRVATRLLPPAALECLSIYLAGVAILFAITLGISGGHFTYTVDDPYIHLELARNLAHRHYGVNPHEFSSPSSSIIWPFLLIPGVGTPLHPWLPFIWNLIFGSAAAFLLGKIINAWLWPQETRFRRAKQITLSVLFLLSVNLAGLVFVGMEHSLQLLLTLACAYGILEALKDRPIPPWCVACAAVGPVVRYEQFAILTAVGIALIAQKRYRTTAVMTVASMIVPVVFSIFLLHLGLHALPNSILAKAGIGTIVAGKTFTFAKMVRYNLLANLRHVRFVLLLLAEVILALRASKGKALILWGVVAALMLQLVFGRFGWSYRYEMYAFALGATIFVDRLAQIGIRWYWAAAGLFLLLFGFLKAPVEVPRSCLSVYLHEEQMSRFFRDYYGKDVAVDDLGLASYERKPGTYILDIEGLGSEEAFEVRDSSPHALEDMLHRHDIGLATEWPQQFRVPRSWKELAIVVTPYEAAHPEDQRAALYITRDGDETQIRKELAKFAKTLPNQVFLEIY